MTDQDDRRKERIAMAREICLHRGENPNAIDRGGNEGWEKYESLAGACIREAERLIALRSPAATPAIDQAVISAACRLVAADTYKHPVLSREDAVKAGVAELHDAVGKWHGAQPAASSVSRPPGETP